MTYLQWQELVQSGQQAHHQARELLRHPLAVWERGTWQEIWRAWAEAVLALERTDPQGPTAVPASGRSSGAAGGV
jgi:hypothetical protein